MHRRDMARAIAAVAIGTLVASVPARADTTTNQTVYDALMSDPRFSTTMKMIYTAGAAERVMNPGRKLTVFAATDSAWDNSPFEGLLASLSSNSASSEFPRSSDILGILRGFFVRQAVEPTAISNQQVPLTSAAGRPIEVDGKTMTVSWISPDGEKRSAPIAGQPIMTDNGVIYPMNVIVGQ